jgi:hypothetical protein
MIGFRLGRILVFASQDNDDTSEVRVFVRPKKWPPYFPDPALEMVTTEYHKRDFWSRIIDEMGRMMREKRGQTCGGVKY